MRFLIFNRRVLDRPGRCPFQLLSTRSLYIRSLYIHVFAVYEYCGYILRRIYSNIKVGPAFGYLPNPAKTWIVAKQDHLNLVTDTFRGSGVNVTSEGRPYLGAAFGTSEYLEKYVSAKVSEWSSCVNNLSSIAKSQPQAAFSALTHGLLNKWTYLSRVLPNISHLLVPLDDALRTTLVPTLTGRPAHNDLECDLFALPARQGGLGIRVPSKAAERELLSSQKVTSTLKDHILAQDDEYSYTLICDQMQAKSEVRQENRQRDQDEAERIHAQLPDRLQRAVTLAKEKGASSWLSIILADHPTTN